MPNSFLLLGAHPSTPVQSCPCSWALCHGISGGDWLRPKHSSQLPGSVLWAALAALRSCTWCCSRGSCVGRAQQPRPGGLSVWQEPSSSWERQRRWVWRFPNTVQWLGIAIVRAPNKHSSGFIHQKIKIFNMLANSTERACSCSRFCWGVQAGDKGVA